MLLKLLKLLFMYSTGLKPCRYVFLILCVSVSRSHRGEVGPYLADVLVVAARVLLLQEKLVPHPTSPHSSERRLPPERSQRSPSTWTQSVQRQAQAQDAERGQQDSPHLA